MDEPPLSDLEYEILNTLADEDETTALILGDLRRPENREFHSAAARELDFASLDAVFARLAERGLVTRKQEATDGYAMPRKGVTYTWWSMTARGREVWSAWANEDR